MVYFPFPTACVPIQIQAAARRINPKAEVVVVNSEVVVDHPELVCGKRVVCVEDGPTLTHGGMAFGAGQVLVGLGACKVVFLATVFCFLHATAETHLTCTITYRWQLTSMVQHVWWIPAPASSVHWNTHTTSTPRLENWCLPWDTTQARCGATCRGVCCESCVCAVGASCNAPPPRHTPVCMYRCGTLRTPSTQWIVTQSLWPPPWTCARWCTSTNQPLW